MKMENVCRIVSKNEVVIKSGERAGEVVYRLAVADGKGEGTLSDIQAKIDPEIFDALSLFVKEYKVVFDYSLRSFNGKSYANFAIVDIFGADITAKAKAN